MFEKTVDFQNSKYEIKYLWIKKNGPLLLVLKVKFQSIVFWRVTEQQGRKITPPKRLIKFAI